MSISVKEALSLDCFKEANLIAGQTGLDKVINRVSVLESPDLDDFGTAMGKGDFYLSSLYAVKDNVEAQLNIFRILVNTNSSGLCLIDLYMDSLKPEIKEFADREAYPVMIISSFVPYAAVITEIMDAIIKNKEDTIAEMTIRSLLQPTITNQEVYDMAMSINNKFAESIGALYLKVGSDKETEIRVLRNNFKKKENCSCLEFDGGLLIIMSFEKETKGRINMQLDQLIDSIDYYFSDYRLGISRFHRKISDLNVCIKEALLSCEVSEGRNDKKTYYNDLGVYRLLMLIKDEPELKRFHDEIVAPLQDYDRENGTSLLITAISYVDNDGAVRKTAEHLYQHENTIRYRINKIRGILDMTELGYSFYERLAIAVKIHKILDTYL